MRILVISNYYPPFELGGWEQLTRDVVELLAARGHTLTVLTGRHRADELDRSERQVRRVLQAESDDIYHYRPFSVLSYRRRQRENRGHFDDAVRAFRPDIVFINGMWNLPRDLARHAELRFPGRVVYYIASHWPAEPDAHTAYWELPAAHPAANRLKRLVAKRLRKDPSLRPDLRFERACFVSDFMRRHLAEAVGRPVDSLLVVHNGIEPDRFAFSARCLDGGPLRLLYAGQVSAQKGAHTAVEAAGLFLDRRPECDFRLTFIGSGAQDYLTSLENTAIRMGVRDRIAFKPPVQREEMPGIFSEHDIFLFPSVWEEPLARVVQEAMACGLVVIGTDTGGTPELLVHGHNGLVFPAGDAAGLAGSLEAAIADNDRFASLSRNARRTVETRFTMDRMVDSLESVFLDSLKS